MRCAGEELPRVSACSTPSPDSSSDAAHHWRVWRHLRQRANFGPHSLVTTVPANTSPIRLPFRDNKLQITAGLPKSIQISTKPDPMPESRLAQPLWTAIVRKRP